MATFGSEFPVNTEISKAKFVALALSWVRGIKNSSLSSSVPAELFQDAATYRGEAGEFASFLTADIDGGFVAGVRHEKPEDEGRVWRTEAVLTNWGRTAVLKVRGQCLALDEKVPVFRPNKPYLIRLALDDGWATQDGPFMVSDKPIFLGDLDVGLASSIIFGGVGCALPVVYASHSDLRASVNSIELAKG